MHEDAGHHSHHSHNPDHAASKGGFTDPLLVEVYDGRTAEGRKTLGKLIAANNRAGVLRFARSIARRIAKDRADRTCTEDDVGRALVELGVKDGTGVLGPAAGSLFSGNEWKFTGRRVRSFRVTNHRRELKVWELKHAFSVLLGH